MNDLKFAFRQLLKNRGFTAVAVLTLALGIGANTAIFSLVDAVLLQSVPARQPKQLFFVTSGNNSQVCYPLIDRFQMANEDVGQTFAYRTLKMRINTGGQNEIVAGQLVSGTYFSALGIALPLGRSITASDDQSVAPPVAVITYGCWERRFGREPSVIGKMLSLNGVAFTIIGVAPSEFYGLDAQAVPEVFVPVRQHALLNPGDRLLEENGSWVFSAVVRLNPGITEEAAQGRLTALYQQYISETAKDWIRAKTVPEMLARGVRLIPAGKGVAGLREKFSRPLLVLMGASVLVFLVACANVANLLLAKGMIRQREIALRLAFGASKGRVARMLLTESLLIAGLGAALGLLLANLCSQGLLRFLARHEG